MPTNMNQMMSFMQMVKNGNPQEIAMNLLQERASQGNPMFQDILSLVQNGKQQEVEAVVRGMAQQRGFDFDKEFNSFRQTFGL